MKSQFMVLNVLWWSLVRFNFYGALDCCLQWLVQSCVFTLKQMEINEGQLCVDYHHTTTTTILRPFFRDHPGEPVPVENFWTLWCKGRLTEADTLTIWLGATPSRLTNAYLHHLPIFFTGRIPFLPPNQQHQSTEGSAFGLGRRR